MAEVINAILNYDLTNRAELIEECHLDSSCDVYATDVYFVSFYIYI